MMRVLAAILAVINAVVLTSTASALLDPGDESILIVALSSLLMAGNLILTVQVVRLKTALVRPVLVVDAVLVGLCLLGFVFDIVDQGLSAIDPEVAVGVFFLLVHMALGGRLLIRDKRTGGRRDRLIKDSRPARPERFEPEPQTPKPPAPGPLETPDRRRGEAPSGSAPDSGPDLIREFVGFRESLTGLFTSHGYSFRPEADEIINLFTLAALVVAHGRWYGPEKGGDPRLAKLTELFGAPPDPSAGSEAAARHKSRCLDALKTIEADYDEQEARMASGEAFEALEKKRIWSKSWTALYTTVTDPLPSEVGVKDWNRGLDRSEMIYGHL